MTNTSHPYGDLTFDCMSLLQCFVEAYIHHIHCEGNHCTNLLAKEGLLCTLEFVLINVIPFSPKKKKVYNYFNNLLR